MNSKVAEGIYQLKVPIPDNPLENLNAYLVEGKDGWLLVDTGWNTELAFNSLESQLKEHGISFKDISQIVVTHIHPDHYGLAGKLKSLCPATLLLHREDAALIQSRYVDVDGLLRDMASWLRYNGVPEEEVSKLQTASLGARDFVTIAFPDIALKGGERISTGIFELEVIWTPGHSPGHVCLYEPKRKVLFAGDHVLPTITPNVGYNSQSKGNPLRDFISSLRKVAALDVELVLPAHEHIFQNLKSRIDEMLEHHREREAEILLASAGRLKSAHDIAAGVTWMKDLGGIAWGKMPSFHRRMAVMETIAHLEFLRFEGKVNKAVEDGVALYASQVEGIRVR